MKRDSFRGLDKARFETVKALPTPSFVIDERRIRENCELLREVKERAGCKILLAQKAFSNYELYPLMSRYLDGTEASGLYEARLGKEAWPGGEVHVFSAAFREQDFDELTKYAGHIVFNSPTQLKKFGARAKSAGMSVGLRVNPECSTQDWTELYDPCAPGSRLGTTREAWDALMTPELIAMLDGLHFHTLCEQNSDDLEATVSAFEEKFGAFIDRLKWVNFGGGHHITRSDYDTDRLVKCVKGFRERHGVEVYLEPGEAAALDAGYLVTEVLDIVKNGGTTIAIIDASAACHLPDVLEGHFLPFLDRQTEDGEYAYRLAGPTCLAGDVFGDYRVDTPINVGDRLVFGDMAIYSTCKTNTFNGMPLPDIRILREDGTVGTLARFGYDDFKCRLGGRA